MERRRFLAGAGAAALLPPVLAPSAAQGQAVRDPISEFLTKGAPVRTERVHLELPLLIENGNSVPLKVTVDSPMRPDDHVRVIHLLSAKNPVRQMASFHLGPRAGRAEIQTRVRLAGSQRVVALAQMSDGSFWSDSRSTIVTLSACIDEVGS
jgi:sulfur-oxidizing protein SoxY